MVDLVETPGAQGIGLAAEGIQNRSPCRRAPFPLRPAPRCAAGVVVLAPRWSRGHGAFRLRPAEHGQSFFAPGNNPGPGCHHHHHLPGHHAAPGAGSGGAGRCPCPHCKAAAEALAAARTACITVSSTSSSGGSFPQAALYACLPHRCRTPVSGLGPAAKVEITLLR